MSPSGSHHRHRHRSSLSSSSSSSGCSSSRSTAAAAAPSPQPPATTRRHPARAGARVGALESIAKAMALMEADARSAHAQMERTHAVVRSVARNSQAQRRAVEVMGRRMTQLEERLGQLHEQHALAQGHAQHAACAQDAAVQASSAGAPLRTRAALTAGAAKAHALRQYRRCRTPTVKNIKGPPADAGQGPAPARGRRAAQLPLEEERDALARWPARGDDNATGPPHKWEPGGGRVAAGEIRSPRNRGDAPGPPQRNPSDCQPRLDDRPLLWQSPGDPRFQTLNAGDSPSGKVSKHPQAEGEMPDCPRPKQEAQAVPKRRLLQPSDEAQILKKYVSSRPRASEQRKTYEASRVGDVQFLLRAKVLQSSRSGEQVSGSNRTDPLYRTNSVLGVPPISCDRPLPKNQTTDQEPRNQSDARPSTPGYTPMSRTKQSTLSHRFCSSTTAKQLLVSSMTHTHAHSRSVPPSPFAHKVPTRSLSTPNTRRINTHLSPRLRGCNVDKPPGYPSSLQPVVYPEAAAEQTSSNLPLAQPSAHQTLKRIEQPPLTKYSYSTPYIPPCENPNNYYHLRAQGGGPNMYPALPPPNTTQQALFDYPCVHARCSDPFPPRPIMQPQTRSPNANLHLTFLAPSKRPILLAQPKPIPPTLPRNPPVQMVHPNQKPSGHFILQSQFSAEKPNQADKDPRNNILQNVCVPRPPCIPRAHSYSAVVKAPRRKMSATKGAVARLMKAHSCTEAAPAAQAAVADFPRRMCCYPRPRRGVPPSRPFCRKCLSTLGRYLLTLAHDGRAADIVSVLDTGIDVNIQNSLKWTPLHKAAAGAHERTLMLLLERGADVNARTTYGFTALHLAAINDRSGRCVSALVCAGADLNCRSRSGRTPLDYAEESNNKAAIQVLESFNAARTTIPKFMERGVRKTEADKLVDSLSYHG